MCRRCNQRPRWRKGEWCAECIFEICCRHYPKWVITPTGRRWVDCVHGDDVLHDVESTSNKETV